MHPVQSSTNGISAETTLNEVKMEPNGTVVKGTSPSMPAPVSSSSAPATSAPIPVLPQNMAGMVPLGAIIHRITNEAFSDLSNLSDVLPSMDDGRRKLHILEYALSKREQFIKLLVLTKWAKSANKFQQCQNIVGFLRHENELFSRAVGGLFETYRMFGRARVRNFDIPTAIDVLTTGTYQRLPSSIKQTYVEDDKPSRTEIAATLDKLDDVIRMRLLCDELVPPAMEYTIGKGKAKFVVPNEFEVTLTVSGPGLPKDVPWRIVGLRILVKPVGGSFQGLETSLNEAQMRAIIMFAQKEMDGASLPNVPQHAIVQAAETAKVPANQALLRLYDYLHMLSLHLQIELIYIQPAQPQTPGPASKRRASATPAQRDLIQAASAQQQEHYLEIRIEEKADVATKIPEGLAGALVDVKTFGYPKAYIKVVWSQVVKGVVPEETSDSILELDPSNLHIERLLLKAVNIHSGQVTQEFYDRLLAHIERTEAQSEQANTHLSKDDVRLEILDIGEQQGIAGSGLSGPRALLVRLKGDQWIRIRVDVRTGRVVVREVGKTAEGVDSVIAAFQTRLNDNANNIVDALISLRFSMAMVELESLAILIGLQPYRRLALGKQDSARFGINIQQILYLQYPQHPRHYLVVGVIDQKFCVWLIEVAPTEETAGIWLTLKSIQPVYWHGLKRRRRNTDMDSDTKPALAKRKSVQFDVEDKAQTSSDSEELAIDGEVLSRLEALCRARICFTEVKAQLQEHGIQYRRLMKTDGSSEAGMVNMIPMLRMDPSSISSGCTEDLFQFVASKLTGWWDNQRETCNFVVQAKLAPDIIPPNMENGLLDGNVSYYAGTGILNFTYKTRGTFIQQFKEDWEKIVRMLRIIRQLHAPTTTNPFIRLDVCHFHHVKLVYFGRYTVGIKWVAASAAEKRSTSGIPIETPPRFRHGLYELELSVVQPTNGLVVNPHRRTKYFLQDMFNREADLHALMNTLVQTCSIMEVLDRLENTVKEDAMGTKLLSVVPRSAHHIRVIYRSKYALDIRAFSRTHLSMLDASYPCESYWTNLPHSQLPPPPTPSVAPALVASGKVIPQTTKGHLHYAHIEKLIGAIEVIDVNKEDEEFNEFLPKMPVQGLLGAGAESSSSSSSSSNTHAGQVAAAAGSQQYHYHSTSRVQEAEPYELMPLPTGVVCSRSASGRVLYRIAKHMEGLPE
ncbi:mediator complex subunit [Mortierella sp. GBA43]|nr:mediator complex subunit [Mortierella sp. GBA43]